MFFKRLQNFFFQAWRKTPSAPAVPQASLPKHCPQIDLALIHSTTNGRYAVDTDGIVYPWPDTLQASIYYLGQNDYVRVNKSFLVAYKIITNMERDRTQKVTSASRERRVFRLILNLQFNTPIYTTYENSATIRRIWLWKNHK